MFAFMAPLFIKRAKLDKPVFIGPPNAVPKDVLKYLMRSKDAELTAEFFSAPIQTGSLGMIFRKWKAKYPGDFAEVDGSSNMSELFRNPRRHIILSPGGTGV